MNNLLERVAAIEHEQWASWAKHLLTDEVLSDERCRRWSDCFKLYCDLTEDKKEQDRIWARKTISAICDEIDEGGIGAALKATYEKQNINMPWEDWKKQWKWQVDQNKKALRFAIGQYLSHLKSTTETKGVV